MKRLLSVCTLASSILLVSVLAAVSGSGSEAISSTAQAAEAVGPQFAMAGSSAMPGEHFDRRTDSRTDDPPVPHVRLIEFVRIVAPGDMEKIQVWRAPAAAEGEGPKQVWLQSPPAERPFLTEEKRQWIEAQTALLANPALSDLDGETLSLAKEATVFPAFSEVEIRLDDLLNLEDIRALPKAPDSQLDVLNDPLRVVVQLPDETVARLIKDGVQVTTLRRFYLLEGGMHAPVQSDNLGSVAGVCGGGLQTGSNDTDVPIPDAGNWVASAIPISGAGAGAAVTCIDVHYEIIHRYIGDLDVDLNDSNFTYNYDLWGPQQSGGPNLNQTVTGILTFNGEEVDQRWLLYARDEVTQDAGYIDTWWIKVYYDASATIFSAWWSNQVDEDQDGYVSYARLNVDVDVEWCAGEATVFEKVYWKRAADTVWNLITTTAPHTLTACSAEDALSLGYQGGPHNLYDWLIEVYRTGEHFTPDATIGPRDDFDLNGYAMELPEEERAFVYNAWWTDVVDRDGDGCPRQATLGWDVDVTGCDGSLTVYENIFWRPEGNQTWLPVTTTNAHTIVQCSVNDVQTIAVAFNSACGPFEWKIDVYRTAANLPDDVYGPTDDPDFDNHREERAFYDCNDFDCDDGLACTGVETCDAGGNCQVGTPIDCDDGVGCTFDSCSEPNGACSNQVINSNCPDDGAFCNGQEVCDLFADCISTGNPCSEEQTCNEETDRCETIGACCNLGRCTDNVEVTVCQESGGTPQGAGTQCVNTVCLVYGACCDDGTGVCNDGVASENCLRPLRFAIDTPCSQLDPPCAGPLGACCLDGECLGVVTEADCLQRLGTWFEDEDCANFICPQPPQACCFADVTCSAVLDGSCTDKCPCNPDMNCDGELNAFDIDPFKLAMTDPATYRNQYPNCFIDWADIDCDGDIDELDGYAFHCRLGIGEPPDCMTIDAQSCSAHGGTPLGPDTACTNTQEACCSFADGACLNRDPVCCVAVQGSAQGTGTSCGEVAAVCCLGPGCTMVDPQCCDDLDGVPSPIGEPVCLNDNNGNQIDDACETPPIEVDRFPFSIGEMELRLPGGAIELIDVAGEAEAHVFFEGSVDGSANSNDGDSLDEVSMEMVELNLEGDSPLLGHVQVSLNPNIPSRGEIEEKVNNTPGTLDVPPFTETGMASSYFDMFFEVTINVGPAQVQLYTIHPKRMSSQIAHKPPGPGAVYENLEDIQLYDANGRPTAYWLSATRHRPNPRAACCLADGECLDIDAISCEQGGGVPQGPDTLCADVDCRIPLEACCLPDGTCVDTDTGTCRERQGVPNGPGTACLGDGNGNKIDDACEGCPNAVVIDADPRSGTVDARQPHPLDSPLPRLGIGAPGASGSPGTREPIILVLEPPVTGVNPACFNLCETRVDPLLGPNSIQSLIDHGKGKYEITLHHAIMAGGVTTIQYKTDRGFVEYTSHPANANVDNASDPGDVMAMIDMLNGQPLPLWGLYSTDIDRTGKFSAADVLRTIDLLNGAGEFEVWLGTDRPISERCP